jgi:hypothetical protein
MTYTCPVCGFNGLDEPPCSPEGYGLFEICPSCGFQFGVTDDDLGISFQDWRESWIAKGMPWSSNGRRAPEDWNPKDQLCNLQRTELDR